MDLEDLQYTDAENDRYSDLLLPVHLKTPDNSLRQEEHRYVGRHLDAGRGEHHVGERVAFAWKIELPDGFMRPALHVQ